MVKAAVGLGSNLGNSRNTLEAAVKTLAAHPQIQHVRLSKIHRTAPVGVVDQPDFHNGAAVLETTLAPAGLLALLLSVERTFGRNRDLEVRWGPRTLDLDLLLYGDRVIQEPGLAVPHPRLVERLFALEPLAELAGDWVIPGTGRTVAQAAEQLRNPPTT